MASVQNTANAITLKGSADIVTEFFDYGINSILYQRGLYPSESFSQTQKYGLTLLTSTNEDLKKYLSVILSQLKQFLLSKNIQRVVLIIVNVETKETVERWEFIVDCDKKVSATDTRNKDLKEIKSGIRDVIRQVTASITFLPLLEGSFSFDLLLYTDKETALPSKEWADSNPHLIQGAERVQLRSFTSTIHKVEASVSYKNTE